MIKGYIVKLIPDDSEDQPWTIGYYDSLETARWDCLERPYDKRFDGQWRLHDWQLVDQISDIEVYKNRQGDHLRICAFALANREALERYYRGEP